MMYKTRELTGRQLDAAVALALGCEGIRLHTYRGLEPGDPVWVVDWEFDWIELSERGYSTDWTHAGPIIEREGIGFYRANASKWWAHPYGGDYSAEGPNALVAAMRCFVKSRLGEEIELPEKLS